MMQDRNIVTMKDW